MLTSVYNPYANPNEAASDRALLRTIAILDQLARSPDVTQELSGGELVSNKDAAGLETKGLELAKKLGLDTTEKKFKNTWWLTRPVAATAHNKTVDEREAAQR